MRGASARLPGLCGRKALELITPPARRVLSAYRRATWRQRAAPDFVIIGAQKSGTTSLFYYLSKHPQLLPSFKKEVHFFDGGLNATTDNFSLGESWYRSHFPLKIRLHHNHKTFEASPMYMFHPLVPSRMSRMLPEAQLIAVLRNPTDRAISHYFHSKRKGREPLGLWEALEAEEDRLKHAVESRDNHVDTFIHHSYQSRGLYYDQLMRFRHYFAADRILVFSSERLFESTACTLQQVFAFVGIDQRCQVNEFRPHNVARNKSDIDPSIRKKLDAYFSPHNRRLYDMLGQDLGW